MFDTVVEFFIGTKPLSIEFELYYMWHIFRMIIGLTFFYALWSVLTLGKYLLTQR